MVAQSFRPTYIISLPNGEEYDDLEFQKRLAAAMHREFPDYFFIVDRGLLGRSEGFRVSPIYEEIDGEPVAPPPLSAQTVGKFAFFMEGFRKTRTLQ